MADIVNLRMARKRRDRAEKERFADENRAKHGLDKATRRSASVERDRREASLDGHRLDPVGRGDGIDRKDTP